MRPCAGASRKDITGLAGHKSGVLTMRSLRVPREASRVSAVHQVLGTSSPQEPTARRSGPSSASRTPTPRGRGGVRLAGDGAGVLGVARGPGAGLAEVDGADGTAGRGRLGDVRRQRHRQRVPQGRRRPTAGIDRGVGGGGDLVEALVVALDRVGGRHVVGGVVDRRVDRGQDRPGRRRGARTSPSPGRHQPGDDEPGRDGLPHPPEDVQEGQRRRRPCWPAAAGRARCDGGASRGVRPRGGRATCAGVGRRCGGGLDGDLGAWTYVGPA